ncbi:MAG: hypothetical protein QOK37_1475 [Thermoanaerobaculia bacterium]|jgi:hypothetical protein|nr:hypothetical protein [Thermoanaerobaculia bacterium]
MLAAALLLTAVHCAASDRLQITAAPVMMQTSAPRGAALVLHLDDVRVASGESAMLRLFINTPNASAKTSTSNPGFLQDLYLVPSRSARGGKSSSQNFTVPLPSGTPRGARISVHIIPIEAGAGGEMNAAARVHVSLKRPYVTAR